LRTNLVRGGVIAAIAGAAIVGVAAAANGAEANGVSLTNVPTANEKAEGYAPASRLSPELQGQVLAQGSTLVENPSALTSTYGYDNDVTTAGGFPQTVPTKTNPNTEAHKTEPDKNTYLVLKNGLTAPTRATTTVRASCSKAMRAAWAATATPHGSTWTPMPRTR
jgi:hypothetical protein